MKELLEDFHDEILNIYATFKVTAFGLSLFKEKYDSALIINKKLKKINLVDEEMGYGIEISREKFERENSEYGSFNIMLSGVFLSSIYQLWEDKYRQLIANKLKTKKENIKNDLIGEINLIRQAVIHNQFRPTSRLKNLKILNFIKIDEKLNLSEKEMSKIILLLIEEIDLLKKKHLEL